MSENVICKIMVVRDICRSPQYRVDVDVMSKYSDCVHPQKVRNLIPTNEWAQRAHDAEQEALKDYWFPNIEDEQVVVNLAILEDDSHEWLLDGAFSSVTQITELMKIRENVRACVQQRQKKKAEEEAKAKTNTDVFGRGPCQTKDDQPILTIEIRRDTSNSANFLITSHILPSLQDVKKHNLWDIMGGLLGCSSDAPHLYDKWEKRLATAWECMKKNPLAELPKDGDVILRAIFEPDKDAWFITPDYRLVFQEWWIAAPLKEVIEKEDVLAIKKILAGE